MLRWRRNRSRVAGADVHLFVLWPRALAQAERIVADIERRFRIHELIRARWTPERVAENFGRFYGPALPPGVEKHVETGEGEFLVAIVSDAAPRYRVRQRTIGKVAVNARVFDAKQRYRAWTGGGHLVHATNDREEAERDLFLLFGRSVDSVAPAYSSSRPPIQSVTGDLLGADGWASLRELLRAMELSGGYVLLDEGGAGPPEILTHAAWAAAILKARPLDRHVHEVQIGRGRTQLRLTWIGDGSLDAGWQTEILRRAVRSTAGTCIPSPEDSYYLSLQRELESGKSDVRAQASMRATLDEFIASLAHR